MKTLDPVIFNSRKDFILRHARRLFATKGFAETSMDDIAHACRLQKASLYHYFESKQTLLQDLIDWGCSRWAARLKDFESGRSLRETLTLIATLILEDLDQPDQREFFTITHFESHSNPAILQALKESPSYNRNGFYAVFAKHLEGKLPPKKIGIFITQFMGALLHYATLSKLHEENLCLEEMDDKAYIEQLTGTFAKGIQ